MTIFSTQHGKTKYKQFKPQDTFYLRPDRGRIVAFILLFALVIAIILATVVIFVKVG